VDCWSAPSSGGLRLQGGGALAHNGIRIVVVAVHAGYVDTDMTAHLDVAKSRPDIAGRTLAGIKPGLEEVWPIKRGQEVNGRLPQTRKGLRARCSGCGMGAGGRSGAVLNDEIIFTT